MILLWIKKVFNYSTILHNLYFNLKTNWELITSVMCFTWSFDKNRKYLASCQSARRGTGFKSPAYRSEILAPCTAIWLLHHPGSHGVNKRHVPSDRKLPARSLSLSLSHTHAHTHKHTHTHICRQAYTQTHMRMNANACHTLIKFYQVNTAEEWVRDMSLLNSKTVTPILEYFHEVGWLIQQPTNQTKRMDKYTPHGRRKAQKKIQFASSCLHPTQPAPYLYSFCQVSMNKNALSELYPFTQLWCW